MAITDSAAAFAARAKALGLDDAVLQLVVGADWTRCRSSLSVLRTFQGRLKRPHLLIR